MLHSFQCETKNTSEWKVKEWQKEKKFIVVPDESIS